MDNYGTAKRVGLFLGPILFLILWLMPTPEGMTADAKGVAATTALMAVWWITEAIPIPATSLIPIVLFPLVGGVKASAVTPPYANYLIFLFMGGFFLAVTMERWNLHRRVALHTIKLVGTSPSRMILGFMLATAFLSMWVSNTATTMMMVPIGLAVISQAMGMSAEDLKNHPDPSRAEFRFGTALMLGTAYAASIGGLATIIGTPPNAVLVGQVNKLYGQSIGFGKWMLLGVPLTVVMLAAAYFLLTKVMFRTDNVKLGGSEELINQEIAKLGPMKKEEKWIVAVGLLVATLWIVRGFLSKVAPFNLMNDTTIAIFGAVLMFIIPSDFKRGVFLLDWRTAVKIPWDVILLFGGGLAIAAAFKDSGLAEYIASTLQALEGTSALIFVAAVTTMVIFLTEVTSNTATATLLIPIMAAAAIALGVHPYATMVPACLAASFAFMLPVATPPNAVIFGSGCVTIGQMAKAGVWLNIIGIILITVFSVYLMPMIWGIDLTQVPVWALPK